MNIWSPSFDIKGHKGYLEKTWTKNECPINWQNVVIGQTINYIFPHSSTIYVCEVVHMRMYYGDLEIQAKVVNIFITI